MRRSYPLRAIVDNCGTERWAGREKTRHGFEGGEDEEVEVAEEEEEEVEEEEDDDRFFRRL